jgi:PAS domain S-box-containing protein
MGGSEFLTGGGAMGALMRAHDWSRSPLGPPETWPERLRGVVDLMLASKFPMFVLWGRDYACLYNDGYIPLLGRRHPDALGRPFRATWPEIWSEIEPLIERAFAGESTFFDSLPLTVLRNGYEEAAAFTFSYSPVREEGGNIGGMFCAAVETTGRVQTERRLAADSEFLRGLFAQAPSFMAVLRGPDHMFELANDAYMRLVGHRDVIGKTVRDALPEVEAQGFLAILDQAYRTGEPFVARGLRVMLRRDRDGPLVQAFVDLVYQPITGPDGQVVGIFAEGSDVTEAQEAAQALRRNEDELRRLNAELARRVSETVADHEEMQTSARATEQSFRILVEGVRDYAIYMLDPDGRVTSWNSGAAHIKGYSAEEAVGSHFSRFYTDEDRADGLPGRALAEAAAEGRYGREGWRVRKDGTRFWASVVIDAIRDEAGELVGFAKVTRDVTEQRETRIALENTREALFQAQKMEAVGQLTGGIAHDFNNLLTGIVGSLDMLQTRITQGRTDGLDRYAKAAISSANRAAALTHRLLAFSRRQPLDPRPVNANQLVNSMEDLLRRTIGESIQLEFVLAGGLWPTLCDPNQLENAILNLAINGRDAMPDGGKLTIETCNTHLDRHYASQHPDVAVGQYVCICVTDSGSGMSPEVIARAFEPFFTTKPIGQGTGLGLSMIYGFARQSEGHAKIYSEPGRGTTVKIYLPRTRAAIEADAGPERPPPPRASGETVLVVEDEPVVRDLAVEVLEDLGYRAIEAADGQAGLSIVQSPVRIDLLLTDMGLPGLNGRQLADLAREVRPGLKVLFITGYAENAVRASGFLEPGMEMITKPFAVDALARRIREMIEG